MTSFAGQHTNSTIIGYDVSSLTVVPSSGSSSGNSLYGVRVSQAFQIGNANASWSEVATAYFKGVRRSLSVPTITTQAGVIIEPPTAATSDQIGLLIRQQTAQSTATNRHGVYVEAHNSGTNRYNFYGVSDTTYIGGRFQHAGLAYGIFGATPSTQYGTTGTASGFAAGTSTTVTVDSTFTGNTGTTAYTMGDIVFAMKRLGGLAY